MARHLIPDTIERAEPRRERVSAPASTVALSLVRSLRPAQWTKNLIIFAALMFGQRLLDVHAVLLRPRGLRRVLRAVRRRLSHQRRRRSRGGSAAIRSSGTGRLPPVRCPSRSRSRPQRCSARRRSRPRSGCDRPSAWSRTLYLALLAFYSGPLKHIVIIDVLTIAVGFVLRAAAGAVVIDVPISHWLLFLTILAGAVPGPEQAAARAGAARGRRDESPAASWRNTARTCSTR